MTRGSSMFAITFRRPPQPARRSISDNRLSWSSGNWIDPFEAQRAGRSKHMSVVGVNPFEAFRLRRN